EGLSAPLVTETVELIRGSFSNLNKSIPTADRPRRARAIDRESARLLFRGREILVAAGGDVLESQARTLSAAAGLAARMVENLGSALPARLPGVKGRRAPVRLRARYENELLPRLLEHLTDVVARFDARADARIGVAVRLQGALADALDRIAEELEGEESDAQAVLERERQSLGVLEREMLSELDRVRAEDLSSIRGGTLHRLSQWVSRLNLSGAGRRASRGRTAELLGRLRDVGTAWGSHQALRLDEAELQARLRAARHRMQIVLERALQDIQLEAETTIRGLTALGNYLVEGAEGAEVTDSTAIPDVHASFDGPAVVARIADELREAVRELPEEWTVRADPDGGRQPDPLEPAETRVVGLRAAADYRLQATLVTPLEPRLLELGAACARGVETGRDVTRLVRFAAGQEDGSGANGSLRSVLSVGATRVSEAREQIASALHTAAESAIDGLRGVEPHLEAGALAGAGLDQDDRGGASARWSRATVALLAKTGRAVTRHLVGVWYRRSRGVILGERLRAGEREGRTPVDRLLTLVESQSPTPRVIANLPFYYRQLFLEHAVATRDFWAARPRVEARVELAVERFRRGFEGGILIVGDPGSGKSSLVAKVAQRSGGAPVLRVSPPPHVTADRAVFQKHLRISLGVAGDLDESLARLPAGTLIVVDDLDLWWERRRGGLEVVEYVLDLIDRFGGHCLFLVAATTSTERLLRGLVALEERFLASIPLEPFTAEELRDIVLVRHRSSGMGLLVDGRPTQGLADWRLARFFNQLFDRTRGNVGEALQSWIASIDSLEGEEIRVGTVESPRLSPLRELRPRQRGLIGALMVHRRMPAGALERVTGLDSEALAEEVVALRRTGLVEEAGGVLTLNRFIEPELRRDLRERGVL
ncbi:MAG: ATP-binding protein, partial [Gemmatimonadota bacterium]|nr:ATP-binding protein [Gemmatimonadota bacterium]